MPLDLGHQLAGQGVRAAFDYQQTYHDGIVPENLVWQYGGKLGFHLDGIDLASKTLAPCGTSWTPIRESSVSSPATSSVERQDSGRHSCSAESSVSPLPYNSGCLSIGLEDSPPITNGIIATHRYWLH